MPKFLNNIDLNSNQLLSPVIHVSSQSTATNGPAGNATGTEGQIFYNSHAKALYFRDDSAWRPIGDISGVSAGAGLSGGGTGGDVTLTIDISEFSAVTPTATDSFLTLDSDGSTEQLTTISALATLLAGTGLTASSGVLAVGNAATVTTNANLTGHITSSGNAAVLGSFTVAQLSTALSNATISGNNSGDETKSRINALDITEVGALASGTIATGFGNIDVGTNSIAAGSFDASDGNINNVGTITLDSIDADGTTIKIGNQASKTVELGKANTVTNDAPTNPSVQTSVSVLGDMAVAGNLTITGDFTTTSTSNTSIKDTIIVLNGGHTGAQTKDIAVLFERGDETNVAFRWDESAATFDLIATLAAGNEATGAILPANPNSDGEHGAGTANYQNLRVNAVNAPGGFTGIGSGLTTLNGSNISSGTIAAARVGALPTSKITSGTFANALIASGNVTQHEGDIDHDALTNFASNEHFTQANITTVGTIGTGVWNGTVIASAYLDSDTAHLTGTQTFSGAKTFSGGLILDDGSGASPILKFRNQDNDYWTLSTQNTTNNLLFYEGTSLRVTFADGGDVVIPGSIDLGGSIDVDGTMEADAITLGGASVFAADTTDTLGTSDTLVPTQAAVKTYVDAQTSGDSNTGGRQAFVLNNSVTGVAVSNSNKTYTITHGMGSSFNYGVEVIRNAANSGGGETVYTDVTRTTTTVVINFAVAPTAGDYTALVCKY